MNRLFPIFLFIISISFFACNNDDDNDGVSVNDGCSTSWKVDGQSFKIEDMALCVYFDNTLNLSSSVTGGEFQLQIDPITSPGTYTVDISNPDLFVYVAIELPDGRTIVSSDATIVVEEISSSRARGSFSGNFFNVEDINQVAEFSVTDGQFNANF